MAGLTEGLSARFSDIDQWSSLEAVTAMYEGQLAAVAALQGTLDLIADAADLAAARLAEGGKLVYVGAGTSGRLAVLDGVELGPTFGWLGERISFCLAGGPGALTESVEGAEDNTQAALEQLVNKKVDESDVVIGVAASGTTPFTVAALEYAKSRGALTIGIANNDNAPLTDVADHGIIAKTGYELVAGSTRMKAGTAQKAILNILSTTIMMRLGKVYRGLMVDMVASNEKLRHRAIAMVSQLAGISVSEAKSFLSKTNFDIKKAILVSLGNNMQVSMLKLEENRGDLRAALSQLGERKVGE